ncbi:MAG TPA: aminotransferase class IV [Bacteroidales bacterium]|nr:aminotransferase class IV [Bacteroidales bacterium]
MRECYGPIFSVDGEIKLSSGFNPLFVFEGESFYEVLRVFDQVPIFFEDHIERLWGSLELQGKPRLASADSVRQWTNSLIKKADIANGNLKIVFNFSNDTSRVIIYFVEAQYPDEEMYRSGVDTILYYGERKNPVVKVFNLQMRNTILRLLVSKGAYEALLVNVNNCITEGSRSNIFFIKNNELITAPDECVLGGITRRHILDICNNRNIPVELRCMPVDELGNIDSAFISGTSPHLLAIRKIDENDLKVDDPLLKNLYSEYQELVESYIAMNKHG